MQLEKTYRSRKPSSVQNPIRFVPRQVLLVPKSAMADSKLDKKRRNGVENSKEKKEKEEKKKAKSSEEETLVVDFHKGAMENRNKDLLCSIAAFLESSGFHRTLSMFRSEAEIENDGPLASLINLEDLFCRHSDCSEGTAATAIDWSRENGGISRKAEGEKVDDASEHIHKKKRKQKNENDGGTKAGINEQGLEDDSISLKVKSTELGDAKDLKKFKAAKDSPAETIDKKKKKKKKSIPDSHENVETILSKGTCETAQDTDIIVPKTDMKDEPKNKNKHNISSDVGNGGMKGEDHNMSKEIVDKKIGEAKSSVNSFSALPAQTDAQHKTEKKKKKKMASKFTIDNENNEQVKSDSGNANKEKLDNSEKHRKRKRTPVDGPLLAENETVTKKSRHVKVDRGEDDKEAGSLLKSEKSDCELGAGDEKKTEKSSKKESGGHLAANDNLEKNENLGGSSAKSTNKEKRSAEPKTVNAFQRVKIDQVKFADDRLQDNSYWALDEKGSGYGAKAQEVLGQVRGRDFRHEKTKKKRGSYRGGQIDLQSHSIKFNSDEDE